MASVDQGADDLRALGRALSDFGGGDLKKETLKGFRESGKGTIRRIKASTGDYLPQRGGLAARVARSTIGTRTRLSGANAGIEIKGTGKTGARGLSAMNEGAVRHPVCGRRNAWVSQSVRPGFFTDPIEEDLPQIRSSIQRVLEDALHKIASTA
jgi:hypothetical protein